MNRQEAFSAVVIHLRAQGAQCTKDGACRYRDGTGKKCAIGALIPDDLYDPIIEGVGIGIRDPRERDCLVMYEAGQTKMNEILCSLGFTEADNDFLSRLQDIHDVDMPSCWEDDFVYMAKMFNLEVPK